jgi:phosphoribosylformylglycinamidine (FGAM) synthase-like amidotransferase family enzyme
MKESENIDDEGDDGFWSGGSFVQSISKEEMEKKNRTIHMKNNEEMDYACKRCKVKISAHNKDWHGGMCDDCFNKEIFSED